MGKYETRGEGSRGRRPDLLPRGMGGEDFLL
jgi:hypothetical protein